MKKEQIEFLKELQLQMKYEEQNDYDSQASPRFWVIMDYRKVPGNEEYDSGEWEYFYSDGDVTLFKTKEELVEFLNEYYSDELLEDYRLQYMIEEIENHELYDLIDHLKDEYEYFDSCYVVEEEFIVPNTMFITKNDAKEYLRRYGYNHSPKSHTYAMTAVRSPSVSKLFDILHTVDFDKLNNNEGVN